VIRKSENKYAIQSTPQIGFEAGLTKYFHLDTAHPNKKPSSFLKRVNLFL
jgi:hypothetical protein